MGISWSLWKMWHWKTARIIARLNFTVTELAVSCWGFPQEVLFFTGLTVRGQDFQTLQQKQKFVVWKDFCFLSSPAQNSFLICSCQNKLLFLHFVVGFSEKMSRMVLFLLILLKVSQSISAQQRYMTLTLMQFTKDFNSLQHIQAKF